MRKKNTDTPKLSGMNKKILWWVKALSTGISAVVISVSVSNFIDNRLSDSPPPDTTQNYVSEDIPQPDPNAGEYVDRTADATDSKGVSVPGWQSLSFPKDKKEVEVDFYNPESNEGQYQLTFELRLPDESEEGYEVLYKSGLIDPGLHVQNITLSRELKAGTYDAVIHVQPYCMNEPKTATNNADMQTQLIVS